MIYVGDEGAYKVVNNRADEIMIARMDIDKTFTPIEETEGNYFVIDPEELWKLLTLAVKEGLVIQRTDEKFIYLSTI